MLVTVRAFPSTEAFREATLAPGWVAAFTEGQWIGAQPLRTLSARHLLEPTMRHEFLHALLENETGAKSPLWLREGLVEVWSKGPRMIAAPLCHSAHSMHRWPGLQQRPMRKRPIRQPHGMRRDCSTATAASR